MMQRFSTTFFIAGSVLLALIFGIWLFVDSTPTSAPSEEVVDTSLISVAVQPAGESVLVDMVAVPAQNIWVAVREINGEKPGNVLGAARVQGLQTSVTVPLLRATQPSRLYIVELYRDDNAGLFDQGVNSVYIDTTTGKRVDTQFSTTE